MNNSRLQWLLLWARCLAVLVIVQWMCVSVETSSRPIDAWSKSVDAALRRHASWERDVKRRASFERHRRDTGRYIDDTAHIVNVQEYYRIAFEEGWKEPKGEKEKYDLLNALEALIQREDVYNGGNPVIAQDAAAQLGAHSKPIRGRYIVLFQSSDADDYLLDRTIAILQKAHLESKGRIRASDMHTLRHVGKGFTATLNSKAVELMAKHPLVAHIEEDSALKRSAAIVHKREAAYSESATPWNLDRLTKRANKLDHTYKPDGDGKNVDIYIIDTGVRATHQEFEGRVHYAGFDAVDYLTGSNSHGADGNGHGTHCAAVAAGKFFGVAKKANIYNLRALNSEGVGAVSGIVLGMDKIVNKVKNSANPRPSIISQSLGVKKSPSLNQAIVKAAEANIISVGASGNQASYSCDYSPASAKVGIAVGATNKEDQVTIFSNTGECTDIMAPGVEIVSATNDCDTCTKSLSGTSMAAPHVTGAAAILLSKNPQLTSKDLKEKLMKQASDGMVQMTLVASNRSMKTPNRLLYVKPVGSDTSSAVHIQGSSQSRP